MLLIVDLTADQRSKSRYRGPIDCLSHLYRNGGVTNCYRGFRIMAMRDLPASSVYFYLYHEIGAKIAHALTGQLPTKACELTSNLLAGGLAGVLSWLVIFPLDVLKSNLQMDHNRSRYTGIWHCARTLYSSAGLSVFYAGLLPCLLRAFSTNAIILAVNSECLLFLNYRFPRGDRNFEGQ